MNSLQELLLAAFRRVLQSNSVASAAMHFAGNRARAEVSVEFGLPSVCGAFRRVLQSYSMFNAAMHFAGNRARAEMS